MTSREVKALARDPHTRFKFFPRLPKELRLEIFKLAEPEERTLIFDEKFVPASYNCYPPALLHTSREARMVAQTAYRLLVLPTTTLRPVKKAVYISVLEAYDTVRGPGEGHRRVHAHTFVGDLQWVNAETS